MQDCIILRKKKRMISYFLCAESKSVRQNGLSRQIFKKNEIEAPKNAFFAIFENARARDFKRF